MIHCKSSHMWQLLPSDYSTYVDEHEQYDTKCDEIRSALEAVNEKMSTATENIISKHALQRALTKMQVGV